MLVLQLQYKRKNKDHTHRPFVHCIQIKNTSIKKKKLDDYTRDWKLNITYFTCHWAGETQRGVTWSLSIAILFLSRENEKRWVGPGNEYVGDGYALGVPDSVRSPSRRDWEEPRASTATDYCLLNWMAKIINVLKYILPREFGKNSSKPKNYNNFTVMITLFIYNT